MIEVVIASGPEAVAVEVLDAVIGHALAEPDDLQIARCLLALPSAGRRDVWRALADASLGWDGLPRARA